MKILVCGGRKYGTVWNPRTFQLEECKQDIDTVFRILTNLIVRSVEQPDYISKQQEQLRIGNSCPLWVFQPIETSKLRGHNHITIINGGASGADEISSKFAIANGITLKQFPADWQLYGRRAGPIRNEQMIREKPDIVVAFKGGAGTADMCNRALKTGTLLWEIN